MELLQSYLDWIAQHEWITTAVVVGSIATIVLSLIAVPVVARRLPADYFLEESPHTDAVRKSHPVAIFVFKISKNIIGGLLVIIGILFLLTPGQGLLTILIGLLVMDFPGKRRFELAIVRRKPVLRALNWLRQKSNIPPLELPTA
ncbi:MAG: hypothetical protein AAF236_12410 [Verrucomicrobiota bacterium]